jgi:DNA-3-methyladenine glycosylase II
MQLRAVGNGYPRDDITRASPESKQDIFLSGDVALRRTIERLYGFDHLPTEEEMVQLAERWRPYRSLAVSYLFASEYDGGA